MVIDPESKMIYLLGGYDGHRDLADFWAYNIRDNMWTCVSPDTRLQSGMLLLVSWLWRASFAMDALTFSRSVIVGGCE